MPLVWGLFPHPINSVKEFNVFMKEFWERERRNLEVPLQEGDEISLHTGCSFDFLEGDFYKITDKTPHSSFVPDLNPDSAREEAHPRVHRPSLAELDSDSEPVQAEGIRLTLLKPLHPTFRFTQVVKCNVWQRT
jgi:hypothetical protein